MNSSFFYHLFSYVIQVFFATFARRIWEWPVFPVTTKNNSSQMNVIQKLFVSLWRDWLS